MTRPDSPGRVVLAEDLAAALNRDEQMKREHCRRCDGARFAVWYDPLAQGRHVECEGCGEVFHL